MRHKLGPTNSNRIVPCLSPATRRSEPVSPSAPAQSPTKHRSPAKPSVSAPVPAFACPHCPKVFGKAVKLERHTQVHHSSLTRLSIPSDILKPTPSPSPSPSPPPSTRSHPRSPLPVRHAHSAPGTLDLEIEPHQPPAPVNDRDTLLEEAEIKQSLDKNNNRSTPVQVRKVLLAALAQANLAFDAGHRTCRRCPDSARSFVSRKDLAAHIVAKHTDPDMHTSALSPPPSVSSSPVASASSLDSAKSMKNSPVRRTNNNNKNNSNIPQKRVEFSNPLATVIGEDPPAPAPTPAVNLKKRPIDLVGDDDMPIMPSVKRTKTGNSDCDEIVPSSGNKPPTGPKTSLAAKVQAVSRAVDSPPRSVKQTPSHPSAPSSATAAKPPTDTKNSNKSVPVSPGPATIPDTNKTDKLNSTLLPPASATAPQVTTAATADVKSAKKDAKGDAKPKREKSSKKKNYVLDFSVMGGIFTNSHKSYYRLVDP